MDIVEKEGEEQGIIACLFAEAARLREACEKGDVSEMGVLVGSLRDQLNNLRALAHMPSEQQQMRMHLVDIFREALVHTAIGSLTVEMVEGYLDALHKDLPSLNPVLPDIRRVSHALEEVGFRLTPPSSPDPEEES